MENPARGHSGGVRYPNAEDGRPPSDVPSGNPHTARPSRLLARRRKPHQAFAGRPSSQSEHASRSARCWKSARGPDGAIRRVSASRHALFGDGEHAPRSQGGGPPCCKWRKCGCAWHSATTNGKHPISSINESSSDRPPWRLSPRPAPFPPRVCGAARSWPREPSGGIPPQTAGIALFVPCREQPGGWGRRSPMHNRLCRWNLLESSSRKWRSTEGKGPDSRVARLAAAEVQPSNWFTRRRFRKQIAEVCGPLSGGGKQLLCLAARGRVAFAGDFFQRLAVEDVDQSAPVPDETRPLQKAGGDGHGGAANAEHLA